MDSFAEFDDLTDTDLLGIKCLAAVVGRPREVGRRGAEDAGPGAPQDEGELTQHAWKTWRRG